jgi:HK97 family phage prohead protease
MEPDFTGWATKSSIKCSDGITIEPHAFQHQDQTTVPLLWQHGHNSPENVLGHVDLKAVDEGVRVEAYFNDTPIAQHAKKLVDHKDIRQLSIWANELTKHAKRVVHGSIKEVSLVLAGANPGAMIDPVVVRHADGDYEMEDDFIITTGEDLELSHADMPADDDEDGPTVQDVYDTMNDDQKAVVQYLVGEAIADAAEEPVAQSGTIDTDSDDTVTHSKEGNTDMAHNLFQEKTPAGGTPAAEEVLSHDAMKQIFADATKNGSLKEAVNDYAISHGITDIGKLFPDAEAIDAVPEWIKRRTEWVGGFLGACRKSPFNRIKTLSADITHEEARAKGYVTGNLKKEEFFGIKDRTTTPTTVYKKQKLDRDDMVDITDFDVVSWMKAEMRIMLDEEIARAALIGDGRDVADDDKINEQNIRPILKDHELYTTKVYVNINDANSSIQEFIDAVVTNRHLYRGSGLPTMYTTELWIAQFLLLKDSLGRRIYKSLDELATELRVSSIVPVEVMEDVPDLIAIFVNPSDYVLGATRGGEVTMFDDFDIDYNQYKYLIETRLCGALVKVKSAMVFYKTAGTDVLVAPNEPTFNTTTGVLSIVNQTGVVYKNAAGTVLNAAGSPYAAIAAGASVTVYATPAPGYYFATSNDDEWTFTRDA